jgi:SAM-dependent methyltransferase
MGTLQEALLFSQRVERSVSEDNYMIRAYSKSTNSLYSHTIFRFIADEIKESREPVHILDLGCADGRSRELLTQYGVQIANYFGIDSNSKFSPSLTSDIRNVESYINEYVG